MSRLNPGDLLTVREALAIVPVSRSLLYSLIAASKIPSVRVGGAGSRRGRILVAQVDLERFIKQSRVGGAS